MVRGHRSVDDIWRRRLGCPWQLERNSGPYCEDSQGSPPTHHQSNRLAKGNQYQCVHLEPHLSVNAPLGDGVPHSGGLDQQPFRILPMPGEHPVIIHLLCLRFIKSWSKLDTIMCVSRLQPQRTPEILDQKSQYPSNGSSTSYHGEDIRDRHCQSPSNNVSQRLEGEKVAPAEETTVERQEQASREVQAT